MKFNNTLTSLVLANLKVNKVPFLIGEPGIGKTSWVEELGNILDTKVFTLQCNELSEKADLTGVRTVPAGEENFKQIFFPHADIMDAVQYADANPSETPILFMDEINRTTSDVTSALLSIPTRRRVGNVELPSNLKVILAGNDAGNVTTLDTASISRFVFYKVVPDAATFLATVDNVHPIVADTLTAHPEHIFEKVSAGESDIFEDDSMDQFTTPRTLHALSDTLNNLTYTDLMAMFATPSAITAGGSEYEVDGLMEFISGHIGFTNAAKDIHRRVAEMVDSPEEITIEKPAGYDDAMDAKTVTEIEANFSEVSDVDLNEMLLYALTDVELKDTKAQALIRYMGARGKLNFTNEQIEVYSDLHNADKLVPKANAAFRTFPDFQRSTTFKQIKNLTKD